jgi:hypothetical protein
MRQGRLIVTWMTAFAAALVATASSPDVGAEDKPDAGSSGSGSVLPACMSVATEARYVPYGYNHVVILRNGCTKAATCSVATDVNPQAVSVEVAASSRVEVLTFTASPARTFTARVSCRLH